MIGRTPPSEMVTAITGWLRARVPAGETGYCSNSFTTEYLDAAPYREIASGLLAAFLDESRENLLLWFRPEVPSTVTWGGDPRKPVLAGSGPVAVLPRRSFERWIEERTGFANPWADWQLQLAGSLAEAVEGVVLRQRRKIDDLTSLLAEKERLLEQKDLLTREIDHRVKNSLQIVSAFLQMQRRQISDGPARQAFADTSARVMSVARVHDSLYQADRVDEVDLGQTIENLCNDLAGLAGDGHAVDLTAEPGLMVPYRKAVALSLIATELVTNAFQVRGQPGRRRTGGGLRLGLRSRRDPAPGLRRRCRPARRLGQREGPRQGIGARHEAGPGDARTDQRPARRRQQSRRLLHDHRVSPANPILRDGLHARLRAATDPAHRALEDGLDWRNRVATMPGYRDLLARLYGFHAAWEPEIGAALTDERFLAPRRRLSLLTADLGHLGLGPGALNVLPRPCLGPALEGPAAAMGALYVLEGSTLGGKVIGRHIAGLHGLSDAGLAYYRAHGAAAAARCGRRCGRASKPSPMTRPRKPSLTAAAVTTFAAMRAWLSPAPAAPA